MAGVTVTRLAGPYSIGDRWQTISTVAMDSSYPTGGEALTKAQLGFAPTADPEFYVEACPNIGFVPEYDHVNSKLQAYWVDTTVDGNPLVEVVDTTSLATVVFRVKATGKYRL